VKQVIRVITSVFDSYTRKTTKVGTIVPLDDKQRGWFECLSCGCQHDLNVQEATEPSPSDGTTTGS